MTKADAEQKTLNAMESERHLVEASNQYIRGNITLKEFQKAEREYMPDYFSATLELAKTRRRLLRLLERFFNNPTLHTHG
jgi:hypothetical protein